MRKAQLCAGTAIPALPAYSSFVQTIINRSGAKVLASALLCFIVIAACVGQTTNARLDGTIQDQSGAVVPGAKIEAVNNSTQARAEATADSSGNFVLPTLAPGLYTVSVEAPGFRKTVLNN